MLYYGYLPIDVHRYKDSLKKSAYFTSYLQQVQLSYAFSKKCNKIGAFR